MGVLFEALAMTGKRCNGQINNQGVNVGSTKAYCEGLKHRIDTNGASIGDNPHLTGSPDADSWDRGWSKAQANSGGTMAKGDAPCCAVDVTTVITP